MMRKTKEQAEEIQQMLFVSEIAYFPYLMIEPCY